MRDNGIYENHGINRNYRNNRRSRKSRKAKSNRKFYILAAMIIASILLVFVLGSFSIPTSAQDNVPKIERNYKSIEIQRGDSLWSIAETYAGSINMSTADYVKALKKLNGLHSDRIISGTYLVIFYGSFAT